MQQLMIRILYITCVTAWLVPPLYKPVMGKPFLSEIKRDTGMVKLELDDLNFVS